MNLLLSLVLLGSLALTLGCHAPGPGAINIARFGEASQESDYTATSIARNAIDGNGDNNYAKGSCTHTNGLNPPWWRVNLKHVYRISVVIIRNRGDCCKERLMGAEVRIGNNPDNNNQACGTVTSVVNDTIIFCCGGHVGQFVSVVIPGESRHLTLCEVEIYGHRAKGHKWCF